MTAPLLSRSSSLAATAYAHPQLTHPTLAQFSADPYPAFVGVPVGLPDPQRTAGGTSSRLLLPRLSAPRRASHGQRFNRSISLVFPRQFHSALQRYCRQVRGRVDPGGNNTGSLLQDCGSNRRLPCPTRCSIPLRPRVATIDPERAATEVQGIFGSGAALGSAYSGELSLIRQCALSAGNEADTRRDAGLNRSDLCAIYSYCQ